MDTIIMTKHLINALSNKSSIWNTDVNLSEEKKELTWTEIAGILQCEVQTSLGIASVVDFVHATRYACSHKSKTC